MQCIFRANMADNINTLGVATPNKGIKSLKAFMFYIDGHTWLGCKK